MRGKAGPVRALTCQEAPHNHGHRRRQPTAPLGGLPEPVPGAKEPVTVACKATLLGSNKGHPAVALCFWAAKNIAHIFC